ncbi:Phosphotransferase enzyme family protein [Anaeromicropila populeti]|uniref:Phosphotransferase enzyme family protein n=2 Tax=Anaeromicropila populeti TaxID=37658 RepID=A0A1I6HTA4_9FIRM|nr:Phosphotransferase enzyme family protein [Anaeromicropila populeti]
MKEQEVLEGGREGKIFKQGEKIIRPANPWSINIHAFLDFLIKEQFQFVPKPFGFTEHEEEILSYVPGTAYNYPLPKMFLKDEVIAEAAILLHSYHQVSKKYINRLSNQEVWMLPTVSPIEVMCHGDFAPYNVTIIDGKPAGIIDFDTLHPGPALWDVAYAVYRWVPFTSPENPDHYDDLKEQIRKTKVFMDAYNATTKDREELPSMMVKRLSTLVQFMLAQADSGNEDFSKNVEDGHVKLYKCDIQYILENKRMIINGIK